MNKHSLAMDIVNLQNEVEDLKAYFEADCGYFAEHPLMLGHDDFYDLEEAEDIDRALGLDGVVARLYAAMARKCREDERLELEFRYLWGRKFAVLRWRAWKHPEEVTPPPQAIFYPTWPGEGKWFICGPTKIAEYLAS